MQLDLLFKIKQIIQCKFMEMCHSWKVQISLLISLCMCVCACMGMCIGLCVCWCWCSCVHFNPREASPWHCWQGVQNKSSVPQMTKNCPRSTWLNWCVPFQLCVRSLATFDCIGPLKMGMKSRRDTIALAAEMLAKMFDRGEEDLVQQVTQWPQLYLWAM